MFIYNKDKFSAVIQDNSVCKVTDYGLDDRGLILVRGTEVTFSLSHCVVIWASPTLLSDTHREFFTG